MKMQRSNFRKSPYYQVVYISKRFSYFNIILQYQIHILYWQKYCYISSCYIVFYILSNPFLICKEMKGKQYSYFIRRIVLPKLIFVIICLIKLIFHQIRIIGIKFHGKNTRNVDYLFLIENSFSNMLWKNNLIKTNL